MRWSSLIDPAVISWGWLKGELTLFQSLRMPVTHTSTACLLVCPHTREQLTDARPFPAGMVDTIFADVAQPNQAQIVAINAKNFLKNGGHFVISIKANCIDSTVPAAVVFAREVKKLQQENFKPHEQLTLEPYERDHAVVRMHVEKVGEGEGRERKRRSSATDDSHSDRLAARQPTQPLFFTGVHGRPQVVGSYRPTKKKEEGKTA